MVFEQDLLLLQAIKKGDRDRVKQLLAQGTKPNVWDKQGNSALIYAAQKGDNEIVNLLIQLVPILTMAINPTV